MNKVKGACLWPARLLIFPVVVWNLQCAAVFLFNPSGFAPSFELEGVIGQSVIRSLAILFIMWNIPYLFALFQPARYSISLVQALFMQAVGFIGESWLLTTLPVEYDILRVSIMRFMFFDGIGVPLLAAALIIVLAARRKAGMRQGNLLSE